MFKLSFLIIFLLLLFAFPINVIKAQVSNELLKVKELGSDFSSDKIKIDLRSLSSGSLSLKLQSQDPTETYQSNLDDQLGIKIKQVTITDPNNASNTFTIPINQFNPLSNLRSGIGIGIAPPGITPPSFPDITLPPIGINIEIPEWLKKIAGSGGSVNVEVQRDLIELASPNESPDQTDWAKITGVTDTQLTEQEETVNSLLKASIKTAQPIRINQPLPPGAPAAVPPAPAAAPTPTPCTSGADCTSAGGELCSDDRGAAVKTAIGCIHTNPIEFVKDLLKFIVAISGGFAFLMMLIGAYQMLSSAGNPDSLNAGRERLTSAIIGLLFVIFAVLLMQIIGVGFLALPGFGNQ